MGKMKLTGRERITISIPSDLKARSLVEANRLGISFSGVVSVALTYYFSTNAIANLVPPRKLDMGEVRRMYNIGGLIPVEGTRKEKK